MAWNPKMLGQLTQMTAASAQRVDAVSPAPAATGNGRFADHLVDARRRSDNTTASPGRGAPSASDRGKALPDRGQHSPHYGRHANNDADNRARPREDSRPDSARTEKPVTRSSSSSRNNRTAAPPDPAPRQTNADRKSASMEKSERPLAALSGHKAATETASLKTESGREPSDLLEASDIKALLMALAEWQGGELSDDAAKALLDADATGPVMALDDQTWLAATETGEGLLLSLADLEASAPELTVDTVSLEALLADEEHGEALSLMKDNSALDIDDVNDLIAGLMRTLARAQQAEQATDSEVVPETWEQTLATLIQPVTMDSDQSPEFIEWSALVDKEDDGSDLSLPEWLVSAAGADAETDTESEDVNAEEAIAAGVLATDSDADGDSDDLDTDEVLQSRSRRDRAALTENMLNRLVSEGGRAPTAEENAPLRVNMDQLSSREVTRQTTLDMAREHVERQLQVKNSAGELTQRLSERLVVMIGQDIQEARIRLDPPELGRMDVKVTTQNDQVQVQVIAQQPMVRDLLEQHAHRLREMLEQQGFTKVDVDVSDQPWQDGQDSEQSEQGGQNGPKAEGEDDDGLVENPRGESMALGLVDHYV